MKKSIHYTIPIFVIIFSINPAFGFAEMTANDSTAQLDLVNTTESDQDLVLLFQLIEMDAVEQQSENNLLVRETLVFKNTGTKNFSGTLRTWVPDGAKGIIVEKRDMSTGSLIKSLTAVQNGNIISWRDSIEKNNPLSPLYFVGYVLKAEPKGTFTKTKHYSKMLLYPTLITKQPNMMVLKVIRNQGENVAITDEKGNSISASGNPEEGRYEWQLPEFKELNIEISKPAVTPAGIAGYVILGLVIVLVISYPLIRTRSEKIQALEEKIRNSLKREETEEIYEETAEEAGEEVVEEATSEVPAEAEEEVSPVEEDTEFEGKTREELENLKNEMLSKLSELDKEYASGNLLDEEYDELRKSYQKKAERITKKLEQHG